MDRKRPPLERRISARSEVSKAGGTGAVRKKREAEAQAEADPTFLSDSPAEPEPSGEGTAKGKPAKFALLGTRTGPDEVRFDRLSWEPAEVRFGWNPQGSSPRFASAGDPGDPAEFALTAIRKGLVEVRFVESPWEPGEVRFEGNPKGNRPRPQGLGRNPIPETTPSPHRRGEPDGGQWGLVATPAPIAFQGRIISRGQPALRLDPNTFHPASTKRRVARA